MVSFYRIEKEFFAETCFIIFQGGLLSCHHPKLAFLILLL